MNMRLHRWNWLPALITGALMAVILSGETTYSQEAETPLVGVQMGDGTQRPRGVVEQTQPEPQSEAEQGAGAQTRPEPAPLADAQPAAVAAPVANAQAGADLRALIEVLREDASRERLIEELERNMPTGVAADTAPVAPADPGAADDAHTPYTIAPAPDGGAVPDHATLSHRIAAGAQEATEGVTVRARNFYDSLAATKRRLGGLVKINSEVLRAFLLEILIVLAVTVGVYWTLNRLMRRVTDRIARAADTASMIGKVVLAVVSLILSGVPVVMGTAAGYLTGITMLEPAGGVTLFQSFYLNAFLAVGLAKVVVRALLAPNYPVFRALPMNDATAGFWSGRIGVAIAIQGYGKMLLVPAVIETVSIFTGRATAVMVYLAAVLWLIIVVFQKRRQLPEYMADWVRGQSAYMTVRFLVWASRFWHWAVIAYLLVLLFIDVTQAGHLLPTLIATLKILLAISAGVFAMSLVSRVRRRGVYLPGEVVKHLPLLEGRLNTFVPFFLRLLRVIIFVIIVTYSLHVVGVADIGAWLEKSFGINIASTVISLTLILIFAFALWLTMASWVDYRLNPTGSHAASTRERTLLTLLRNAATIVIVAISLMFALSEIGINIAPLIASAGVLGLAIGFGAQKMVQDIITGIFIQFENAINVGDVVMVGGTTGTVDKLTIRSVSLRDVEGTYHIIPFSSVDAVSNYNRGFAYHVADIGIAYREDIDEAKAMMLASFDDLREIADHQPNIVGDLEWFGVNELGDSAVVLRARIKTAPGAQWGIGRAYRELVKKRFDAGGIEIPFPQTTVWFGEGRDGKAPAARMKLEGSAEAGQPSVTKDAPEPIRPTADDLPVSDDDD